MRKTLNIMRTALAVLAVTAAVQACMSLRQGGDAMLDELYSQYASRDDMRVALVKEKGVCNSSAEGDSVYVDMLMLTALDSAAWSSLQDDFGVPQPMEAMQRKIDQGNDIVTVGRYRGTAAEPGNDMRVISYLNRSVSIIHAASEDDMRAVTRANMENNIRNTTI